MKLRKCVLYFIQDAAHSYSFEFKLERHLELDHKQTEVIHPVTVMRVS